MIARSHAVLGVYLDRFAPVQAIILSTVDTAGSAANDDRSTAQIIHFPWSRNER